MRGLYVHIPFCEHICFYCDFAKRVPKNQAMMDEYLTYLEKDYTDIKGNHQYDTIYIGGGTPSMLSLEQLDRLLHIFIDQKPIEYTIEVNPESYTHEKGQLFKKMGINRVSLGVQSFEQKILDYIGRKHKNEDVFNTIASLNSLGIDNISIDLIFAIPGQTLESIKHDLNIVSSLPIRHISYYSLILEEKTVFYHKYLNKSFSQIDIDLEADMYEYILTRLNQLGFTQYEISNFMKDNQTSLHNKLYWTMATYDAIGAGAHGFDGKYRYYNYRDLPQYYEKRLQNTYIETESQRLSDTIIFGLRQLKGIHIPTIERDFNIDFFKMYKDLDKHFEYGLVTYNDGYLKLTRKGLLLGNQVFGVFI